ncbi:MarR family winged helix-turn-helix transcriptional regulator [Youngiibacter fragilis]|uniref:MarR family transcriptional regulator n=1 Tax=Youngiibacter fragilis 232.1 TaxID=994573 RepID=V7I2F7_9CLOT|nr:MarR family transcriptional regulator [Youngiibacter fragilis]ETA79466.1 MarR family transcriptional regulator [Youngiibacter fragilis 232.1]
MDRRADSFRLAMLIREIYSLSMHSVDECLSESGLTHQQVIVVKLIAHNGAMTVSDICRHMSLSKGTVSGILTRLAERGYIEKYKNEEDLRNTYIRFTSKGSDFALEFRDQMTRSFDGIFIDSSDKDLAEIEDSLRKLVSMLKKSKKE